LWFWIWFWFGEAFDRGDEAVAAADDGGDETRFIGVFIESAADFANGGVDAFVDLHELAGPPDGVGDLLAGDDRLAAPDQEEQHIEGDALDFHGPAVFEEAMGGRVNLKVAEGDHPGPGPAVSPVGWRWLLGPNSESAGILNRPILSIRGERSRRVVGPPD
jgi:hypothetical protein